MAILWLATLPMLLVACGFDASVPVESALRQSTTTDTLAPLRVESIPYSTVAQAEQVGAGPQESLVFVIDNEAGVEKLAPYLTEDDLNRARTVDFSSSLLVAVIREERSTSGSPIAIDTISSSFSGIMVAARVPGLDPSAYVYPAFTVAYHVVRLDRASLPAGTPFTGELTIQPDDV